MAKTRKVVLTGGPCAGKSEVLDKLAERFKSKVIIIPEVASGLLRIPLRQGGPGVPGKDLEWTQEWQDHFQEMVFAKQLEIEAKAREFAESLLEPTVILCDRGILDGAAYMRGGREEFLEKFGLCLSECFRLYDHVIHLRSLATENPREYERLAKTNPSRFETLDQAWVREKMTLAAWQDFPSNSKLGAFPTIEEKADDCARTIEWELDRLEGPEENLQEEREAEEEYLRAIETSS